MRQPCPTALAHRKHNRWRYPTDLHRRELPRPVHRDIRRKKPRGLRDAAGEAPVDARRTASPPPPKETSESFQLKVSIEWRDRPPVSPPEGSCQQSFGAFE